MWCSERHKSSSVLAIFPPGSPDSVSQSRLWPQTARTQWTITHRTACLSAMPATTPLSYAQNDQYIASLPAVSDVLQHSRVRVYMTTLTVAYRLFQIAPSERAFERHLDLNTHTHTKPMDKNTEDSTFST